MGESCFLGHLFQHIWVSLRIVHLSLLSTKEGELMSFDYLSRFFNSFDPAGLMLICWKAEIAEGCPHCSQWPGSAQNRDYWHEGHHAHAGIWLGQKEVSWSEEKQQMTFHYLGSHREKLKRLLKPSMLWKLLKKKNVNWMQRGKWDSNRKRRKFKVYFRQSSCWTGYNWGGKLLSSKGWMAAFEWWLHKSKP